MVQEEASQIALRITAEGIRGLMQALFLTLKESERLQREHQQNRLGKVKFSELNRRFGKLDTIKAPPAEDEKKFKKLAESYGITYSLKKSATGEKQIWFNTNDEVKMNSLLQHFAVAYERDHSSDRALKKFPYQIRMNFDGQETEPLKFQTFEEIKTYLNDWKEKNSNKDNVKLDDFSKAKDIKELTTIFKQNANKLGKDIQLSLKEKEKSLTERLIEKKEKRKEKYPKREKSLSATKKHEIELGER
ncbi:MULTISPECIES: DUF3801 domain-containing protein [unclassified Aerococcus]|uniref:DUF3801 domain-containing protein n=1 Tax=unclassified Aerococcus TaxID=2618060 RepID=UPI0008A280AA|nr:MULTISPECIES: DUF3801 domain-containing protein [unclassified Aerococcus]MDK6679192.1 DUF3801 domain-containing protein [Aerococcus sp. UMB8608]MDK6685966.1 DUF3801 domain-containing protein [Aerococcus sp. UMB8623]MDK6940771.1 DUF3801 domain-containing protein [Aerococcus sp. UMB8487]OFK21379.1 hypothetical protein HMPREF2829_03690 [Aerococcus sp. HMSC072A12]OFR32587.1 hypothetical protein HMPREF2892_08215 [Aerococcus sp. HMSC061A03]